MSNPLYLWAKKQARRRVLDGALPGNAARWAAADYGLTKFEAAALIDELESLPSAGQETTTLTGEEDVEKAPQHDGAFVPGNSRSRPTGREPKGSSSTASAVAFDDDAALARVRADGRDYMRRRT